MSDRYHSVVRGTAWMPDSQRLLIEMLHWACACGGTALNYVQATGYEQSEDSVAAISAVDRVSGQQLAFRARLRPVLLQRLELPGYPGWRK